MARPELAHDAVGEEEGAEVVNGQIHLEAVGGEGAGGDIHNSGIIEEDVDAGHAVGVVDLRRGGIDGVEGGEIELQSLGRNVGEGGTKLCGHFA